MKIKAWHIAVVLIAAFLLVPAFQASVMDFINSFTGGEAPGLPGQAVVATKQLQITVMDQFAGTNVGTGDYLSIWDPEKSTFDQENTQTDSSGQVVSNKQYKSGKEIWIRWCDAATLASASGAEWEKVIVPYYDSSADVQALTYHQYTYDVRLYTAPTDYLFYAGTAFTKTSGKINMTSGGTPGIAQFTLQQQWVQGTDNKGFQESFDPVEGISWDCMLYICLHKGTDSVYPFQIYGMDGSATSGNDVWFWKRIPPDDLSRWKVGNQYRLDGDNSISLSVDMGSGTPYPTGDSQFQCWLVIRSDPGYFRTHGATSGSFGPDSKIVINGGSASYYLIASGA